MSSNRNGLGRHVVVPVEVLHDLIAMLQRGEVKATMWALADIADYDSKEKLRFLERRAYACMTAAERRGDMESAALWRGTWQLACDRRREGAVVL